MIPSGTNGGQVFPVSFMAQKRPPPWSSGGTPHEPAGRAKLWRLDPVFFCSVLGTCLSTGELRKLVGRAAGEKSESWSDLEVHERAVCLAGNADGGAKVLHKALDERHQLTIRRYDRAKSAEELLDLWSDSLHTGDVPGAYWAVLTHRAVTRQVRSRAFGDVHMLSHLVGAANRADIRRLSALDAENAALIAKVERQEQRLRESLRERDEKIRTLSEALSQSVLRLQEGGSTTASHETELVGEMRGLIASLERRVAHALARSERAETRARMAESRNAELGAALDAARSERHAIDAELHALEERTLTHTESIATHTSPDFRVLAGRSILYVGGRPGPLCAIREVVQRQGGVFLHHDGGVEHRTGMIAAEVHRADVVMFPVDCISHDAVGHLKRACAQMQKRYHVLRTSGVGSFVATLERICAGSNGDAQIADLAHQA